MVVLLCHVCLLQQHFILGLSPISRHTTSLVGPHMQSGIFGCVFLLMDNHITNRLQVGFIFKFYFGIMHSFAWICCFGGLHIKTNTHIYIYMTLLGRSIIFWLYLLSAWTALISRCSVDSIWHNWHHVCTMAHGILNAHYVWHAPPPPPVPCWWCGPLLRPPPLPCAMCENRDRGR